MNHLLSAHLHFLSTVNVYIDNATFKSTLLMGLSKWIVMKMASIDCEIPYMLKYDDPFLECEHKICCNIVYEVYHSNYYYLQIVGFVFSTNRRRK